MHSQQQQQVSAHQRQAQQAISDLDHQMEVLALNQEAARLALQTQAHQHLAISEQVRLFKEQDQWDNQTKQNY